jgi:acetyl-CoA synthetase
MRDIHLRYLRETYDETGILRHMRLEYPENYNFAYDICDDIAQAEPDRPAMVWCNPEGEEHRFSFGDIKYWSDKTANYLAGLGIGRGDMVLVIVRRHYQFWFIATALHKLGAVIIPATFMLKDKDLKYRIDSAGVKCCICTDVGDIADTVVRVAPGCATLESLVLVAGGGGGKALQGDVAGQVSDARYGHVLSGPQGVCALRISDDQAAAGWRDFNAGIYEASTSMTRLETSVFDPFLLYFSSGTTGNPKMVLHDGAYALAHTLTAKHWHNVKSDGGLHFTIADTGWGKAVWGKYYGQWTMEACVLTYDYDRFDAGEMLDVIARYGVTTLCCPPTMYRLFVNHGIGDIDLSQLQYCTTAGEALNPDLYETWLEGTGVKLMEGFGQTETPLTICNVTHMTAKPGSMGMPSPLYTVEIQDDEGKRCPPGVTGEIVVRLGVEGGANPAVVAMAETETEGLALGAENAHPNGIMMDYYRDDVKTRAACHDGWYHTGDEAWVDEDGYYWYVGRNDDVIKSSGYRIGPFEVESVLIKHSAVAECAVTGIPDPLRTMAVKATVVLAPGYAASDELTNELQDWVKRGTAPYKYPRVIDYVSELPKTVNGKIRRAAIRNQ